MSSDTFKEIIENLDKCLIPSNRFYSAHRRGDDLELLEDHLDLCSNYFFHIVNGLGIEPLLDKLISDVFGLNRLIDIKQIISYAIYYHDIGKMNPTFQAMKVRGKKTRGNSKHSFFSEIALTAGLMKKFPEFKGVIYLVTTIVSKHHTKLGDFTITDYNVDTEEKEIIQQILQKLAIEEGIITEEDKRELFGNDFEWPKLFLLLKLLYSLLALSDSYSTIHYTYSLDTMYPLNGINDNIRRKMGSSFSKIHYNNNIEHGEPKNISLCTSINELRREILVECNKSMKKLLKKNNKIFMLSVPTGGGKTNISMKLALNILEHDAKVKRIFYVFPYINIIEQNYKVINEALFNESLFFNKIGLISDIYSRAYIDKFHDQEGDDSLSIQKMANVIRNDNFLNNCVNVITNVNFFNSIIKNGGNNRYKIANLCNSVVIIDEIQTLSDKNLRVFYNFIKETSRALNVYYIVMSATLPDFNDFLDDVEVPQIIDDPKKYFTHPIFKRNEIIFRKDIKDVEGIKKLLIGETNKNYKTGRVKVLVTLNLVDSSRQVYDELKSDANFKDFSFYLLNSTISSLRRKKIIEKITEKSERRIILVSTQSVEAGVDIDCDLGIRDYAILDSIEQISGRINRECNAKKAKSSKLYVIKYGEANLPDCEKIYGSQERYKILLYEFNQEKIEEILKFKQFDRYYHTLSQKVKKIARDYFEPVCRNISDLKYQEINNEIDVIENKIDKLDIFVREEIPLDHLARYDRNKIKALLKDPEIQKFESHHKIISDGKINTNNVYQVWKNILKSTDKFGDIYLRRKITSLLNQFVISITNFRNETYGQNLFEYLEAEGFVEQDETFDNILSTPKFSEYYSFKDGLRSDLLKEAIKRPPAGVFI